MSPKYFILIQILTKMSLLLK